MIRLALAAGKYPVRIQTAVDTFEKSLPALSKVLSAIPWHVSASKKKSIPKTSQIGIELITDNSMLKLNTQYRNKPTTTDVLSFSYIEAGAPLFAHEPVGEILISHQKAAIQARDNNLTLTDELCVLVVHGVLHVMGYDHERSIREKTLMHKMEMKVLNSAGLKSGLTGRSLAVRS